MSFWDHLVQLLAQAGSLRGGCPGCCPVRFWISPRMNTPQPDWATQSSVWPPSNKKSLHVFMYNFLFWNFLLLLLVLSVDKKKSEDSGSPFFIPAFQLYTVVVSHEPSFLQVEGSQLSLHLLMWWILKSIKLVLCWSHCGTHNIQMGPYKYWLGWKDHLPLPAGCVLLIQPGRHLCLMTHCWCTVYCPPWLQGPFLQSCFPSGLAFPRVLVPGVRSDTCS